jgi:RNA polymerase sigma factor (TIGR02999 family)
LESDENITGLLARWRNGEEQALQSLIPLVYGELRRLAQFHLRGERPSHTLQATALAHEAYLRLVAVHAKDYQNRAHFFAVCSRVMRQILVDHAREHRALKRGASSGHLSLDEALTIPVQPNVDILVIDSALHRLDRLDPEKCQIVEMRFFAGLTSDEIAEVLGVSAITVKRKWAIAKAWLYHDLKRGASGDDAGSLATDRSDTEPGA